MQNLQQIMLDTIWTSDFTNALVVPFDDTYDRTRNILEHLQQLVDVYPFIRSAFLYCPTSQMVYGSDLTYQPVEEVLTSFFRILSIFYPTLVPDSLSPIHPSL